MNAPEWLDHAADIAQTYAQPILFGAGVVGALTGVALIWRFFRTGHAHTRVGFLAVVLATAFAAEGMWEVATGPMGLHPVMAAGLFGMFEVVMVSQGLLAKHKLAQTPPGDVRRHMNFVWAVAAGSGIVASTASGSLPEFLLRLFAPAVGAGIWWMGITADKPAGQAQVTSWIWTPRRIGIWLGLVRPGKQDLEQVDRDRRIDAITVTAHRLHHGSKRLAGWRKAKLRRLALQADDSMVAEAQRRVARVHRIEKLTDPDVAPVDEPNDAERELLDELRRVMTQATTRLRVDHARAFAPDQPGGPLWSNGLVQMRTSVADQIRTSAMDQARTNGRTSPADQIQTSPPPVDQPATSGAVPAVRTTPAQRTTARLDRVRPVSPATGGEVPPRIKDMVRDLKRAYRGDIPGRRVVMDRMGWTSAGDAQTAINLVRAERAKTTQQ
ncbi:hypothetical protein E1193_13540 [Micromonospora sp. KC606]|uniref:hypothetical protein n=1 Tax=Micromonospora sp. KC606 TaxID=2530379 RepID=UPI00105121F2|nr:hypothetical protein [Micromonospora sp. KC606]TDC81920.1 hypothetical protein E1193_13540 [Micromonospora sp. KC606]